LLLDHVNDLKDLFLFRNLFILVVVEDLLLDLCNALGGSFELLDHLLLLNGNRRLKPLVK
jgi:hypothetical protein